jgi:VanZ family protein
MTLRPHEADHVHRRLAGGLLAGWLMLVLSASLYPFDFDGPRLLDAAAGGFPALRGWHVPSRRDMLVNLLIYAPVGMLGMLAQHALRPAPQRAARAVALAAIVSLGVEITQHALRLRVPSLADWLFNVASAGRGVLLSGIYSRLPVQPLSNRLRRVELSPALVLLAGLWLAAHAAPFVPRLRPGRVTAAVDASLALQPSVSLTAAYFACWLVLSALVRVMVRREAFWTWFAILGGVALASKLLFVGQKLTPDEVLGGALALPVIAWLRRRPHTASLTPLFGLVCASFVVAGLAPLGFAGPQQPFEWPAFADQGTAADPGALPTLERVFLGIGAAWVAAGSALGLLPGVLLLLAIAGACEFAQGWLPARTPEASDLLALLAGTLLVQLGWWLERRGWRR